MWCDWCFEAMMKVAGELRHMHEDDGRGTDAWLPDQLLERTLTAESEPIRAPRGT